MSDTEALASPKRTPPRATVQPVQCTCSFPVLTVRTSYSNSEGKYESTFGCVNICIKIYICCTQSATIMFGTTGGMTTHSSQSSTLKKIFPIGWITTTDKDNMHITVPTFTILKVMKIRLNIERTSLTNYSKAHATTATSDEDTAKQKRTFSEKATEEYKRTLSHFCLLFASAAD